jgi:lysophospholipase L1-like esterase
MISRRSFLKTTAGVGSLALATSSNVLAGASSHTHNTEGALTIVFQGDSITDGNRGRTDDPNHIMGHGYAFSIASRLGADYPDRHLKFINKGISGNTIQDLSARWQADTLNLKPDIISILAGVNNVYFSLRGDSAVLTEFETAYRDLLTRTRLALPHALLVLGNPFILPVGTVSANLAAWTDAIHTCQAGAKKLAQEFDAVWVDYQGMFTEACKRAPAAYWIWDGIHPTVPGHELMAREWITRVKQRKGFLDFIP